MENFLETSGITYTTVGRMDNVYVGMDVIEREYKQNRYLLWKLRDLLEITNWSKIITNENFLSFTEAFKDELSLRQVYNFLEISYNSDIPHSSCLCAVCKNTSHSSLHLKKHICRKRGQVASYNKQKHDLKTGEALIHVDYSQSYHNTQQDEISSVYFG